MTSADDDDAGKYFLWCIAFVVWVEIKIII